MADLKFSQFTNQPTTSATEIVGYDGTINTRYTLAELYEQGYNFSSSQWGYSWSNGDNNSNKAAVVFPTGSAAQYNMLLDLPNAGVDQPTGQRDPAGTSSYDVVPYAYGIDIVISLSGVPSGNLVIDVWNESLGTPAFVSYSQAWDTVGATDQEKLENTVDNWITNNEAALVAANVRPSNATASTLFAGPGGRQIIRLCSNQNQIGWKYPGDGVAADDHRPTATLTNTTIEVKNQYAENAPYLLGTIGSGAGDRELLNPSTTSYGYNNAWPDHFLMPYNGTPFEGKYIQHNFRVNFNTDASPENRQPSIAIALRRFGDDSIIGSSIPIIRTDSQTGKQVNFVTYTAGPDDPFVKGGFYFSLIGDIDSGATSSMSMTGSYGFLLQNKYQSPTIFP